MQDVAHRATAANGAVRAVAVVSTQTVEDARIRHATSATATAALGRSLTAAALLGAGLKDGQTVLLRVLGDGPIGGVIAQADAEGHVRGYAVHPHADLPQTDHRKLDVGGLVGRRGMLHVTRDLGLRTPYHGSAPLVSGLLQMQQSIDAYRDPWLEGAEPATPGQFRTALPLLPLPRVPVREAGADPVPGASV